MNVYDEVSLFYRNFRGEKQVFGRSAEGRELFALFIGGHGSPLGISQYAIHGREYVTALLALAHAKRGAERGGVWILPMTNPDGALLSEVGLSAASAERRARLLSLNGGKYDFSLWKANAEGVDLNVNFDARWGTGEQNIRTPAPENYIGEAPFCAPESLALKRFTEAVKPDFTVSWHTKGEELYWRFHQPPVRAVRDKKLAKVLSSATGYPLREAKNSAGGYKDWCIEKLKIPAFTVEAGRSALAHPLGREQLRELCEKCGGALAALCENYGI